MQAHRTRAYLRTRDDHARLRQTSKAPPMHKQQVSNRARGRWHARLTYHDRRSGLAKRGGAEAADGDGVGMALLLPQPRPLNRAPGAHARRLVTAGQQAARRCSVRVVHAISADGTPSARCAAFGRPRAVQSPRLRDPDSAFRIGCPAVCVERATAASGPRLSCPTPP